jgi:CubicO group peptidase (beta-lactamase class C family)
VAASIDRARLQALLDARVATGEPGTALGVCRNGDLVATAVGGLADLERAVPVTVDTVFDIASSSKQICATTLLLLEREGKLGLDDTLVQHLPELRLVPRPTVRQCLQHTAGLREYFATSALVGAGPDSWKGESDVIRMLLAQLDTDFAPGSDWSYSNTGYIAAAAVVRAVTGRSLAEVAHELVFEPLGMTATRFQEQATALVPNRATGYSKAAEEWQRADSYDEVIGDGAVLTTLADAARWLAFVADGRVLGKDIRDRLLTRTVLSDGREIPYCLGVERHEVDGLDTAAHGGAIEGYRAHLLVALDSGVGAVVLANRSDARPASLADAALRVALGRPEPASPRQDGEASPDEDVLGLWFDERAESLLAVVTGEGGLQVDFGPAKIDLRAAGPGRWELPMFAGEVALVREAEGLVLDLGAHDWERSVMRRVAPAGDAAPPPLGTYLSPELNAIAVIADTDGALSWQCGAADPVALTAVSVPDTWRLPTGVVKVVRGATGAVESLSVSASRMRRLRFTPYDPAALPAGTVVGFPVPLGGPPLPREVVVAAGAETAGREETGR